MNKGRVWSRRVTAVFNFCYAGGAKVVQFPFYVLDLLKNGKPDHTKIGPFIVSQELVAICAYDVIKNHHELQWSIVMVIAVLSFASAPLMKYFISKAEMKFAQTTTIAETTKKTITEDIKRVIDERNLHDGSAPHSMPAVNAEVE